MSGSASGPRTRKPARQWRQQLEAFGQVSNAAQTVQLGGRTDGREREKVSKREREREHERERERESMRERERA
eukprot:1539022-Rhodomonas_salina.1